ncbi:hypothetical protein CDCA_CDCA03G0829 [Cyanidium caldarium]|uniref:Uncharacterized protein n=1 Tax=Cyanidium caldarium TaxID=2771 RepID=A0AAV9IRC0_CYACA|nr:hypothetical protein CDCA_CDCA03G0829 [Cyanidium caldarium]
MEVSRVNPEQAHERAALRNDHEVRSTERTRLFKRDALELVRRMAPEKAAVEDNTTVFPLLNAVRAVRELEVLEQRPADLEPHSDAGEAA